MRVELQLRGVIDAAAARGYPIKVVLFSSEEDTGGDLAPFEDPQDYAPTVTEQLESTAPLRAPVLIVTPHAYGLPASSRAPARWPRSRRSSRRGSPRTSRSRSRPRAPHSPVPP